MYLKKLKVKEWKLQYIWYPNGNARVIFDKNGDIYSQAESNNNIVVLITLLLSSFYINLGDEQICHKLDFLIEFLNNWADYAPHPTPRPSTHTHMHTSGGNIY